MAYLLPKSVFIHTPNTAGQWVAATLDNAGLVVDTIGVVHASPDEIRQEPVVKERDFSFTFVRHPASWYQSMWAHQMDEEWDSIDDPKWFTPRWINFWAKFTDTCRSNSFEEFVRNCINHYPEGFVSTLFEAYTAECKFVGKQERLIEDVQIALDLAGEQYDLTKLQKTRPKNVRGQRPRRKRVSQYSPDLIKLVTRTEIEAIEKYGYDIFPESVFLNRESLKIE